MGRLENERKDLERQIKIFDNAHIQEAITRTKMQIDSIESVLQKNKQALDSLNHSILKNE